LYAYEFADDNAPWFTTLPKPNFPTGAFHGAELQYLFADEQLPGPVTPSQRQLSATMMRYWTHFASTGNPNGDGQPRWLPFQSGDHVQSLAPAKIGSADLAQEHQCSFWTSPA
jgi:para-nitrobenzyl esterase